MKNRVHIEPAGLGAEERQTSAEGSGAWEETAKAALDAVLAAIEPRLRRVGEDLYADLLYAVQDYLLDNVIYNVRQQIAAADRQALQDRQRLTAAGLENARLRRALRDVKHMLTIPAAEYVPAIPEAWDVIDAALKPEEASDAVG